jgi:hypothetical protein
MQKEKQCELINAIPVCEKNKIKQSALCCIYCGKSYKTRITLEKHLILCEITHKSKRNATNDSKDYNGDNHDDELIEQTFSSKKLYQIVIELAVKCNRLENKVADLSKYVSKKIQKMDAIDYLNNTTKTTNYPTILFENITEIIKVEDSDIEFLFHNSFIDTMNVIFTRSIYKYDNDTINLSFPIAAFKQKANTIYVYSKNNNQNQNTIQNPSWTIVSRESFIRFLNIIQFKISKAFSEWRKKNTELLNDDDNHCILYDKTFSKLMEPEFKTDKIYNKFYNNVYKKINVDLPC